MYIITSLKTLSVSKAMSKILFLFFALTNFYSVSQISNSTREHQERYAKNLYGNFEMIGNANMKYASNYDATPVWNNPPNIMEYSDIDGGSSTHNSSRAAAALSCSSNDNFDCGWFLNSPDGTRSQDFYWPQAPSGSILSGHDNQIVSNAFSFTDGSGLSVSPFQSKLDVRSVGQSNLTNAINNNDYFEYTFVSSSSIPNGTVFSRFGIGHDARANDHGKSFSSYRIGVAVSDNNFATSTLLLEGGHLPVTGSSYTYRVFTNILNTFVIQQSTTYKIRIYVYGANNNNSWVAYDDFQFGTCFSSTAINNPPVANADTNTTGVDVPVMGTVLPNDFDPNGDSISVTSNTNPLNGSVAINSDGTYTYTPNSGFVGIDSFQYTICDNGTPALCGTATVTITVEINSCTDGATIGTPTANDPDADGINNICDLDDDNDGILDTDEDSACTGSGGEPMIINGSLTGPSIGTRMVQYNNNTGNIFFTIECLHGSMGSFK